MTPVVRLSAQLRPGARSALRSPYDQITHKGEREYSALTLGNPSEAFSREQALAFEVTACNI